MLTHDLIRDLRSQSTWRLLGLGIVTYGVYYAHYLAKQSNLINQRLGGEQQIPAGLIATLFALSYVSVCLFFGYLFVDENHPVAIASHFTDRIWMILVIVWGFYARNRMNTLTGALDDHPSWFHGLWTFLFSPLYFNYKINVLNESPDVQAVA